MSRNIELSLGEYYHIYNRGVEKRDIYCSPAEYRHFLVLLYLCNTKDGIRVRDFSTGDIESFTAKRSGTLVDICAYCLMSNHFHILIKETQEGGISTFMQKLSTAYTMFFNKRNDRTGSLFQGTFKATHADTDEYLKYLISYIHLNPVKLIEPSWKETGIENRKKAEEFLETYKYSSYLDYIGKQRPESSIITSGSLPEYFETPVGFKENIREWLEYRAK